MENLPDRKEPVWERGTCLIGKNLFEKKEYGWKKGTCLGKREPVQHEEDLPR